MSKQPGTPGANGNPGAGDGDDTTPTTPPTNPGNEPGGEPNNPGDKEGGDGEGGDKKMVPASVMMDYKNKLKNAEKDLAKYKAEEEKREQDEKIKKGEYEDVIATKDAQISTLNDQITELNQYKTAVEDIAKKQLATFKESVDEDVYNKAINIAGIDVENPGVKTLSKIADMQSMFGAGTRTVPSGGTNVPKGGNTGSDRLAELKQKIQKEGGIDKLGYHEKQEYMTLVGKLAK